MDSGYGWKSVAVAVPVGTASFAGQLATSSTLLLWHIFAQRATGRGLVTLLIVSYVLFCPAVSCALYSLLFEPRKRPALVSLMLAGITVLTLRESWLLLDSLLFLPFSFLGVMGVMKAVRLRQEAKPTLSDG